MALPARPTWLKNTLANNLGLHNPPAGAPPSNASIGEIHNYSNCASALLGHLVLADPPMIREPSRAMLETLAWLSRTVFPNALQRYPHAIQAAPAWAGADAAVALLQGGVTAVANQHAPPLVLGNVLVIAVESALELLYESVLLGAAAINFAAGFAALTPILLPGYVVPSSNRLPQVGVLCFGNTAAGAPRLVVSCNSSNWDRFTAMFNWMRDARQSNANMPLAYRTTVQNLSNRLANMGGHVIAVPPAQDLQLAWNNAVAPGGNDAA